jgi:hypothetical protein
LYAIFSVSIFKTKEEISAYSAVCLPAKGYLQNITGPGSNLPYLPEYN